MIKKKWFIKEYEFLNQLIINRTNQIEFAIYTQIPPTYLNKLIKTNKPVGNRILKRCLHGFKKFNIDFDLVFELKEV